MISFFLMLNLLVVQADVKPNQEMLFGVYQSTKMDVAKNQALEWLKSTGKSTDENLKQFNLIWSSDEILLDKISATFCLGDETAARLINDVHAPTIIPPIFKDLKTSEYFRSNLALIYSRSLVGHKMFENALEILQTTKPEKVVDPASYLFYRAVSEHSLMLHKEADESVAKLLDDVIDAPVRYRSVAAIMQFDMLSWQDNDLGWIARKMKVIKDRLDISRGGPKTQKYQKEVLVRLDEMIKEKENKQKQNGTGNDDECPPGSKQEVAPPGGPNSPNPAQDTSLPNSVPMQGQVDPKKLKEIADVWGNLPDKERAKYVQDVTKGMPLKYRETIQNYLRSISKQK